MSRLSQRARTQILGSGLTIAEFVRDQKPFSGQDGRSWNGDSCGCIDDRCVGYHHRVDEECGCLPTAIDEAKARAARARREGVA